MFKRWKRRATGRRLSFLRCQYRSAIFVHSADQQALAIA
jgi:hypothetical protein